MEGFYCVLIDKYQSEIAKIFNDVEEGYDVMLVSGISGFNDNGALKV